MAKNLFDSGYGIEMGYEKALKKVNGSISNGFVEFENYQIDITNLPIFPLTGCILSGQTA
ncbi:hypothetical protein Scep_018811 [Stephania cephalantha]|uniref:Uncharacterized protein n=1 Tax=Stephania cephalantha TaxID=152367 RepID=A0AAP0NKL7_9MAGN